MRNTLPLLARPTDLSAYPDVPSIRLVAATPSASGMSSEASTSSNYSWTAVPSPIAPKVNPSSRKRLVPKKSKLSLLGGNKDKQKERGQDLSDVVRRVGGGSTSRRGGGFEIYVDPTDPEIGEIVMVKKKKSRAGLDGLRWGSGGGALGEITNIPPVPQPVTSVTKAKTEEKDKWWTIGRGRKDSKEKEKEKLRENSEARPQPPRSKTPEPFKSAPEGAQSRARFNSLNSNILLTSVPASSLGADYSLRNISSPFLEDSRDDERLAPGMYSRSATPTFGGLLAPPTNFDGLDSATGSGNGQTSIAFRAIRSVRSMARIGSWAQLKNGVGPGEEASQRDTEKKVKDRSKKPKDESKKKKKEEKPQTQRIRNSGSSFEAGALTASPEVKASLGKKKRSILGLGLPSTMRLPAVRSGSTTSSIGVIGGLHNADDNRLSVDSAVAIATRMRSGSTMSTGSSLRPISTSSSTSRGSSGSSAVSVRWDEAGLETVKELRRKEKETKRRSVEDAEADATRKKANRESRRSSEGRRRTPISDVFPDLQEDHLTPCASADTGAAPLLTLEEATVDGHECTVDESPVSTPPKRARPRPLSEQLLGRRRPQGIHEEDGEGVISILSAATNELAQLINNLDLEATPGATPGTPSPDSSPWVRPSLQAPDGAQCSPTKRTLRGTMTSISSLRPYAQSRGPGSPSAGVSNAQHLNQQIAPWPVLNSYFPQVSATKLAPVISEKTRAIHKRTLSPGYIQESTPPPPLRPLRPAKSRNVISVLTSKPPGPPPSMDLPPVHLNSPVDAARAPSSLTFGSRRSSRGGSSISSIDDMNNAAGNIVFRPTSGYSKNRVSLLSSRRSESHSDISEEDFTTSRPLAPGARRQLGMKGTMGGSDVSAYADELDTSDPDSDIPDELQVILANKSPRVSVHSIEDTLSFQLSDAAGRSSDGDHENSTESGLPVFHLIDVNDNHADMDEMMMDMDEDDDTKKSFDFTGELQKLNESGGSDRASFVEQLEKAFRTPAKIDLRYDFGGQSRNGLLHANVPPVPSIPSSVATGSDVPVTVDNSDVSASSLEAHYDGSAQTEFEAFPMSGLLDAKEPTLLPGSDSIDLLELADAFAFKSSSSSHLSDGELNKSFKFGGFSKSPSQELQPEKVDDSVINSIMAEASELPVNRAHDSGSERARDTSAAITRNIAYRHSRHESTNSFNGFDSFEEVRRGFEFHDYRPSFYPPPMGSTRRVSHNKQESMMSFASISSYGHVVNPGVSDPFDYGLPSLRERPSSEDMTSTSFSTSIDDTFSFLKHAPLRKRVASDASSFYFSASALSNKGHRRRESNMSVVSQGPPISLYNRSFGHRRGDSSTSVSSLAHSYAINGAHGGRAAWAHHKQDASIDSVDSQFSAMHLGRPGIGDKMFDTAANFGAPLTSILASPAGSTSQRSGFGSMDYDPRFSSASIGAPLPSISASPQRSDYPDSPMSYDSIMDNEQRSSMEDSLFDRTGHRTSVSYESVFGCDDSSRRPDGLLPPNAFRPVSSMSVTSDHSPVRDDDTMISMIGGGHVRRQSVGSVIEASPIVRATGHLGKRKLLFDKVQSSNNIENENQPRIIEKASIVSTSSSKFGGERMIKARKGILERQSLEQSCLIAEGEDFSISDTLPVFSRPNQATRSRSSTCTSSSGADTPPLSASDGSSTSGGSQSSIDLSQLNRMLASTNYPTTLRERARARGEGHRRRISEARMSRTSVYETIQEEMSSPSDTPLSQSTASRKSSPTAIQPVFVVDPTDSASIYSMDSWDEERGVVALRRYYELRSEAEYTVNESRRMWLDTPFSLYALQNFDPPRHTSGMQALLASSVESYGPLPSEFRPRRRRTSSRTSPYPQGRPISIPFSPEVAHPTVPVTVDASPGPLPLQNVNVNRNILFKSPATSLSSKVSSREASSPRVILKQEHIRPRVPSTTRRSALGWSKRPVKTSSDLKENVSNSFGQGTGMTPGNNSLRLQRPRPRGRPTPARSAARV
ncbi:hypothetical protein D9757_000790 [Collybiopsis confluens]|uniref:Uncharacterized protein n=1 Tax=Collybiopsis confluens TaxID=2823264 RepID=A0A8H5I1J7_9AGAR|nr:hypothetical protein D9757_000790 [Collybiopsis confluens]